MVDFVTHVRQNICGHKSETMWCMELKISMSDKHHWPSKYTKQRIVNSNRIPYNSSVIMHGMTLLHEYMYIATCSFEQSK